MKRALVAAAAWMLLCAAAPPIAFEPESPRFAAATDEYRQIWTAEGKRIAATMERVSGVTFPTGSIDVIVGEVRPMTGFGGRQMWLRASYPADYKTATLIHELGHVLAGRLPRPGGLDDHRVLYLFLYDVWTDLYGRDYADRMVAIESAARRTYDYAAAWRWALAMGREKRQQRLAALRHLAGLP